MGVASGRFLPAPAYEQLASELASDQLSVRVPGGAAVPSSGGVHITDFRAKYESEDAIAVEILGIAYPLYEQLFPRHVAIYQDGQDAS